jgi:Uma2 family endonuclease
MDQPIPQTINLQDFLAWESQQEKRYEWIDGIVVPMAGVSDDHSAISTNLTAILRPHIPAAGPCFLRGSDRQLVPWDANRNPLGSFYADLFVSCSPDDRKGPAAHYPTLVIEILSEHSGGEFTKKRDAYMGSARIHEYLIIDSLRQYAIQYIWRERQFLVREYYLGPIAFESLSLLIPFQEIYASTNVPFVLHPIHPDNEQIISPQ